MAIEKRNISLKEFIESGDAGSFGKTQIEEMARRRMEKDEDYVHNVRKIKYVVSVGSIRAYFAPASPPPEVVESQVTTESPKIKPVQKKKSSTKKK